MSIENKTNSLVYLVDDDNAIRKALTLLLESENFKVMSFDCAEAFLECELEEAQGCAIFDINMPGLNGMELQKILCERGILLPVIFLTGYGNIPMSVLAIKTGAEDFLTKPFTSEQLLTSIHAAFLKSDQLHTQTKQHNVAKTRLSNLTERELEILELAVQGHSNKVIARKLNISFRTVEHHKRNIFIKTGVVNTLELATIANARKLTNTNLASE